MREATAAAEHAIEAQGPVEGKAFLRDARSIPQQASTLNEVHRQTGAQRLRPRASGD